VYGATLNVDGRLIVEATKVGAQTKLSQIIELVDRAQANKAPIQHLVDRVAGVFVPVVICIALATFVVWWSIGGASAGVAVMHAIAVLIIACPCALGLATPTAIMVGSGRGAREGILFRGTDTFERAKVIDTVVLDKTGTLTEGRMKVVEVVSEQPQTVLAMAAAVEASSEHPVARAIVDAAAGEDGEPPTVAEFRASPGSGVQALVDGRQVRVGRLSWLLQEMALDASPSSPVSTARASELEASGHTVVAVAIDERLAGWIAVADTLRPNSAAVVERLKADGFRVVMVTGDNAGAAARIGAAVGIEAIESGALPEDKAAHVRQLQADGRRIAFVGDGINDAPALAVADLGIAVGTGSDTAIEAGQVVSMFGDPMAVPRALELARSTMRVVQQNLFWAFAYNVAAIPMAALGVLNPMIAAGAMALSSVSVVTNALRLRGMSPQ
ncbi:MAG: heavy metal translocating P-type ATPase, partial [Myxococcota bacterium]